MPRTALVTGGGRGIGASIARELAADGWYVVVAARSRDQVEAVAAEVGGTALTVDVSDRASVEEMVEAAGPVELLVDNAGIGLDEQHAWEVEPEEWWRVFEINVLGAYLCCRAVIPGMIERGRGRIVNVGSGAGYLPGSSSTAYSSSKAALNRFGETLNRQLEPYGISVFTISPGLVQTEMTSGFPDDAPWTPPELAPRLVRALASGRYDALAGRYIHAEHDDVDELLARAAEIERDDLNAVRLRR